MRVIVACRLSQLHDGSTGLDTQETNTVRWAEEQGHQVVAVVQDAKSGAKSILSRTRLRPWMTNPELIAAYDGIVVLRMDRLTRGDSAETRRIEQWADDNHKTLMTTDGLVFPCEGADGIRWDLAKRLAHDEYIRIKTRYGDMQAAVRARGGYIGKVPFGMMLKPNDQGAKALVPGEQWPLVEEAYKRAIKQKLSDIGLWLHEQTGMSWGDRPVLALLRNPVYQSIPEWPEVQAVLDSRAQMGRGANGEKALLAKLLCGDPACNATGPKPSPMYRIGGRGSVNVPGPWYRCAGRGPRRRGCGNMIECRTLDALALGGLDVWWADPYMRRVWIPGDEISEQIDILKARLPRARDRREANDLWDQIEALERRGSSPGHWDAEDTGMSIGEYLAGASLAEQRTFLGEQDIRAWHDAERVYLTINGALARSDGPSGLSDLPE